jgi:hypothetical protein
MTVKLLQNVVVDDDLLFIVQDGQENVAEVRGSQSHRRLYWGRGNDSEHTRSSQLNASSVWQKLVVVETSSRGRGY